MINWYPQNKEELEKALEDYLSQGNKLNIRSETHRFLARSEVKLPEPRKLINFLGRRKQASFRAKQINGIIVPHAGYEFSGKIAGSAYSMLKGKKIERAIVFGPSHYKAFHGIAALSKLETPLGKMKIESSKLEKTDYEHSVRNQIPFLQKLGITKVLPLVVGEITASEAKAIAEQYKNENALFVFSTDLSHFLKYDDAVKADKDTIKIIESRNTKNAPKINACGIFPLMILIELCKMKKWKPKLIEYKNSGDVTGDKSQVVGYAAMVF